MAHLTTLQEATFHNYLEAFRGKLNAAQWKYFVIVLVLSFLTRVGQPFGSRTYWK
jgi:hypothetical protein